MKKSYIAERSKFLKLASLTISEKIKTGIFRSVFRGNGIEFDSVREYGFCDDIRSIDWNVTARSGKVFVKTYREDKDLTVFLCADFSMSMNAGFGGITAKEKALETVSLLGFAALNISAAVGGVFFNGGKKRFFSPVYSGEAVLTMLKTGESFAFREKAYTGTPMKEALETCSKILRSRSLVFVISDFKVENFEKSLAILASEHDVVCVRIVNNLDRKLPSAGTVIFTDYETGFKTVMPTSSSFFKNEREKKYAEEITRWKNNCLYYNTYPVLLDLNDDSVKVLNNFFSVYKTNGNYYRVKKENILWKAF